MKRSLLIAVAASLAVFTTLIRDDDFVHRFTAGVVAIKTSLVVDELDVEVVSKIKIIIIEKHRIWRPAQIRILIIVNSTIAIKLGSKPRTYYLPIAHLMSSGYPLALAELPLS